MTMKKTDAGTHYLEFTQQKAVNGEPTQGATGLKKLSPQSVDPQTGFKKAPIQSTAQPFKKSPADAPLRSAAMTKKKDTGSPAAVENYMKLEQRPPDKYEQAKLMTRAQPTKRPISMQPTQEISEQAPPAGRTAVGDVAGASQLSQAKPAAAPSPIKRRGPTKQSPPFREQPPAKGQGSNYFKRIRDFYQKPRRDRRVAELLGLFVASRQGAPEMCPRITAVALVWLVIFIPIMIYAGISSEGFAPLGMLLGFKEVTSEKNWCYLETALYENADDCCKSN